MSDVSGKRAVVTGGASGIGAAIVAALTGGGAHVLAVDRDEQALASVAEATGCATATADVTSPDANEAFMADAVGAFGGLDLAFLNAGILGRPLEAHRQPYTAADLDLERYRMVMAVNTDAVVYGTVAASRAMTGGGAIIATASTAGLVPWSATPMYAASKHAVVGWVRAMADSLGTQAITINAICPGGVATPLVGRTPDQTEDGRLLAPTMVAEAAIATALGGGTGEAVSVVAGRDELWQAHPFSDVPGFPG